jgi:DNA-binding NtrC family response regulator
VSDKIFVVDDDKDLRENIGEILSDYGFDVTLFVSAELAQEGLKSCKPEIIILDNMMPGIGGMAFIPYVKATYPSVRVIMITAFATIDNAVDAMKAGADDYIQKPFKKDELIVTIKKNLEEKKFSECVVNIDLDDTLSCLSNQVRREILQILHENSGIRFMDITRKLNVTDHTKVNFHLKNLKSNNLIEQNPNKSYKLSDAGTKVIGCMTNMFSKLTS